jgi:hypothetical protein
MGGQLTLIVVGLTIIGLVMWRVSAARSETQELEARQDVLADYTTEVSKFTAQIQQPVREMLGAPFNTGDPSFIAGLETSTERWTKDLEGAAALVQALEAPEEMLQVNLVVQQGFMLYATAAKTYALVPDEAGNKRTQQLLDRATEIREEAGRVLAGAIGLLDQARTDAEMRPSGIELPGAMTPILPTPSPTPTEEAKDTKKPSADDNKKKKNDG